MQLIRYNRFCCFQKEGQVCNGAIILEKLRIKIFLCDDRADQAMLKLQREYASQK